MSNEKKQESAPHIHPVAFPGDGGDGPVQAALHLTPDEGITAVDRHHIPPWRCTQEKVPTTRSVSFSNGTLCFSIFSNCSHLLLITLRWTFFVVPLQ